MSRTAGLGSGDYVAINTLAVAALVISLAGALVVVDLLFVVLPLLGLVLGIIAFRQVRSSNGTQTGGVLAGLAIGLSLLFLVTKVGKAGVDAVRLSSDKQEVSGLIESLGREMAAIDPADRPGDQKHFAAAYDLFDESFRGRVSRDNFDNNWFAYRLSPYFGAVKSMQSNGLLKFDVDPRSGDRVGETVAVATFERGEPIRWSIYFRQLGGKWYIDGLPDVFPPPQDKKPAQ